MTSGQRFYNSSASLSVTIRINRPAHFIISPGVIQKFADTSYYPLIVRTDKSHSTGSERFRALGCIAHNQYRFAQAGSFF